MREVLVGEEGDEDGDEEVGYEERVRYGHGGVQLELFDDEDEIDDEIDTVLKNLSVDEEEMSNRFHGAMKTTTTTTKMKKAAKTKRATS